MADVPRRPYMDGSNNVSNKQRLRIKCTTYKFTFAHSFVNFPNSFRFVAEDFGSGSGHSEDEDVPPTSFVGDEKDAAVVYFVPNLVVSLTYLAAVACALADLHFRRSLSVTKRRLSVCCVSLNYRDVCSYCLPVDKWVEMFLFIEGMW